MGKMTENGEGRNAALVTLSERLAVPCSNALCGGNGVFAGRYLMRINNNYILAKIILSYLVPN